jgi:hypothetical protein
MQMKDAPTMHAVEEMSEHDPTPIVYDCERDVGYRTYPSRSKRS